MEIKITRLSQELNDFKEINLSLNFNNYNNGNKPPQGYWFSLGKSFHDFVVRESPLSLLEYQLYEYSFNGKLWTFDEDYVIKKSDSKIFDESALDFERIKNEGYDGILVNESDLDSGCFYGWDAASVVIWKSFDNLTLLNTLRKDVIEDKDWLQHIIIQTIMDFDALKELKEHFGYEVNSDVSLFGPQTIRMKNSLGEKPFNPFLGMDEDFRSEFLKDHGIQNIYELEESDNSFKNYTQEYTLEISFCKNKVNCILLYDLSNEENEIIYKNTCYNESVSIDDFILHRQVDSLVSARFTYFDEILRPLFNSDFK